MAVGSRGYHFSGLGIALGVEGDGLPQGVEHAVVEEDPPGRDVAQCRRHEQAAIFGAVAQIGAQRAAEPEIEIGRVGVGGDLGLRGTPSAMSP